MLYLEHMAFIFPLVKVGTSSWMNLWDVHVGPEWNTLLIPPTHLVGIFKLSQDGA